MVFVLILPSLEKNQGFNNEILIGWNTRDTNFTEHVKYILRKSKTFTGD